MGVPDMRVGAMHENMYGRFIRRTFDTFVYVKTFLERKRAVLGYV